MTVSDTYGTNSYTAKELAGLLADRLDVTFTERESDYLGVYFLATLADTTRLQIQPNAIPGDDGEDDLYDDEYPDMSALLLITSCGRRRASQRRALGGRRTHQDPINSKLSNCRSTSLDYCSWNTSPVRMPLAASMPSPPLHPQQQRLDHRPQSVGLDP